MTSAIPRLRFSVFLWIAGILGVAVVTATVLPRLLLEQVTLPAPLWVILLASLAQSGLLLAVAVWSGVALAPAVGLHAPAFEAAAAGRPVGRALRSQLFPGLIAGVLGGILLVASFRYAPASIAAVQERFSLPVFARVLYGGITEELLLRWGLMTALVWLAWRFLQHRRGEVRALFVWAAIASSALVFGAGHLPAAFALVGALDANIVAWVIGVNAGFGVLFGYLFWRFGLEAAMIAHGVAHVVNYLLNS